MVSRKLPPFAAVRAFEAVARHLSVKEAARDRFPVISLVLKDRKNIHKPEDLRRVSLIHFETNDGWAEWFEAAGIEPPVFPRGPVFPHCELANTAAEQGLGVALSIDATVRSSLAEGRLVRLFDTTIRMPYFIYSVAYLAARRSDDSRVFKMDSR